MPRTPMKLAAVMLAAGITVAACGSVKMGAAAIITSQRISTTTLSAQVSNLNTAYQAYKSKVQLQYPVSADAAAGARAGWSGSRSATSSRRSTGSR